jgi:hypothetical protein
MRSTVIFSRCRDILAGTESARETSRELAAMMPKVISTIEEAILPELRQEIVPVAEGKSELLRRRFFPG